MIFYLSASTASQFSWCCDCVSWLLPWFQDFLVFFFLDKTTSSPFLPISKEVILLMFSNSVSVSSLLGLPRWLSGKESTCQCRRCSQETWIQSLGRQDPLEKGMATHPSILAWRIIWTEEPGGLQSMGSESQTRLSASTRAHTHTHTHTHISSLLGSLSESLRCPVLYSCTTLWYYHLLKDFFLILHEICYNIVSALCFLIFFATRPVGSLFFYQGSNSRPLHWKAKS